MHKGRTETFLAERSNVVLPFCDPCGLTVAAPGGRRAALCVARVPAALVAAARGPGRPGLGGDVARAGWLA